MTSPHHQEKIPWHCLTDHVDFDGSIGFKIRLGSQIDSRKKAFAHFTRVLASLIVDVAEDQLSLIPKPNASREAWRDVGVQDDALFPVDFVAAISPNNARFLQRQNWEYAADVHFVLMVLTTPANPFRHLAPLIYLAQHPRVAMRSLLERDDSSREVNNDPDLRSFTFSTMSSYLLSNLVLALDSGASFDKGITRASLFHSHFQNRPLVSSSNGSEDPHTTFWYAAPPTSQSPNCREEYSLHCFRLLVALHAIMKETTLRDIAIRSGPYESYEGDVSASDKGTLVDVICQALKSISPAFSDLEPSLAGDPPAVLSPDPPISNISPGQSRFVGLPTEVHHYIYSFLPVGLKSLVNLAATCKRLGEICTPLIYADPFPSIPTTWEERLHLQARSSALAMVLSSKPQLASHIRRLRVRVEGGISRQDIMYTEYPPLQLCLADSITHLAELLLYVPDLCEDCREENDSLEATCHFRTMDAIAAVTRRWPNLSCLSLFGLGASISHLDGAPIIPSPTPAVSIPRHLEKLTIVPDEYGDIHVSWATQKTLMNASSQTLRHLALHHKQTTIHGLPTFPRLERLELTTGLPMEDIRLLLQKSFSSVRFLSLSNLYIVPGRASATLDLSGMLDNLEHLSVAAWSRKPLSALIFPPSVVTLQLRSNRAHNPSISVSGSPRLSALSLDYGTGVSLSSSRTVCDLLSENSSTFQTVRSLELKLVSQADDLPLREIIATRLPKLEVLILSVPAFSNRPRREDYPMDDGFDDIQKAAAVSFFESCPSLNTISFNGIPDVWDPIGRFPGRVWTRDSEDGGARMTGRAALPWKVSEIWGRTGRNI